eukprot:8670709-Prorocentrum_lima.AAC.1
MCQIYRLSPTRRRRPSVHDQRKDNPVKEHIATPASTMMTAHAWGTPLLLEWMEQGRRTRPIVMATTS